MTPDKQLKEILNNKLVNTISQNGFPAKVTKINQDGTITVKNINGLERTNVRLRAANNGSLNGMVLTPTVGSSVLVNSVGNSNAELYVTMFSQLDKVEVKQGNNGISIDLVNGTMQMNDGGSGGLTITPELKTQLEKMSARVDGIIDAISNAVAAAQDGGATLQINMKLALETLVDIEDFSSIENTNVTHG